MLSLLQFQNIPVAAQKVDEHQKSLQTKYYLFSLIYREVKKVKDAKKLFDKVSDDLDK